MKKQRRRQVRPFLRLIEFMEVNTNFSAAGVGGTTPLAGSTYPARSVAAPDDFASSASLNAALQNQPASRSDAVTLARSLIADPNYPSSDALRQISSLFAKNLTSERE
jgi:hypothetical protein